MSKNLSSTIGVWPLLSKHRGQVAGLTASSLISGLLEAFFLVAVARTAFAVSEGGERVDLVGDWTISVLGAVGVMIVAVALRLAASLLTTWQSARLSTVVVSGIRFRLSSAFLRANWAAQHGERSGRLQELLTTYTQQASALVVGVINAGNALFSLIALLLTALVIDPIASVAVIVIVMLLALALRPLRAAVRRQAKVAAAAGMEYATSLNEVSQLGMEMHVFNVQPQTEQRVGELITMNADASRRLLQLRGAVPAIYSGMLYLAIACGLGVVASVDSADLTSLGGVLLIMLRSVSYGQVVQTTSATVNATLPFSTRWISNSPCTKLRTSSTRVSTLAMSVHFACPMCHSSTTPMFLC